ncbi:MAG TPA: SDR family oxidoreductase [Dehalococcoidia bacterium]|nr:SDR family oxidoreductase [Dehalococcoidia bacterium]
MDLGLRGRVAIVGGASKGIGLATATLLAVEGCRVVMAARTADTLERAAQSVGSLAGGTNASVMAVTCDMSVAGDIERLVERAAGTFGGIDIVVNNAGGPPPGRFEQHDDEAWRLAIDTNLMSVVRLVRAALPYLQRSDQARVINITSTAVKEPIDGLILSNAVRLAATGLAKTLSRELGPYGVTVNNVGPGTTMTDRIRPMIEAQAAAEGRSFDEVLATRASRIPVGRVGEPDDVAAMIVFLASAQARQVSGQTVLVDGGATASVL